LEFQAQFENRLSTYRSERAWRIMLAIRKAYTLLVRRKSGGIPAFAKWSLQSVLRGNTELGDFEPELPNILNFVPPEFLSPESKLGARSQGRQARGQYAIIVLPIFDFDFRFQRPQQIAVQFARSGHPVFWISPSRYLPSSSAELYKSIQIRENMWEVHL